MSKLNGISEKMLKEMSDQYLNNEKARVIRNALTENDLFLGIFISVFFSSFYYLLVPQMHAVKTT